MKSFTPSKRRSDGFTLVELLVVIAIIGILIAFLLPSLNGARAAARTTMCASNLHHLYLACAIYAAENKGAAPDTSAAWYYNAYFWGPLVKPLQPEFWPS